MSILSNQNPSAKNELSPKVIYSVLLVIIIIISFLVGFYLGKKTISPGASNELIKSAEAVKNEYEEKIKNAFPEPDKITAMSGEVKSISGNTLKVYGALPTFNPIEDPVQKEFTSKVDGQTKIIKEIEKTNAEIAAEQEEMKKIKIYSPISPYKEAQITLDDLKVGDNIRIKAGEDLRNKSSFTATEIRVRRAN